MPDAALTSRKIEILGHIAQGKTSVQIADELGLAVDSVQTHVKQIFKCLDVHSREEAVKKGRELGFLGVAA